MEIRNILIIHPRFSETFWALRGILGVLSKKAAFPPYGLLIIAAFLPRSWRVKLVDLNIGEELTAVDIMWADYIIVGGMVTQKESAKEVLARCDRFSKPVIMGGPILEMGYEEFSSASHFFLGEALETFPEFLAVLAEGKIPKRVYESNTRPDLAKSPTPRWDLVNLDNYVSAMAQFNSGCPFGCTFCSVRKLNGAKLRSKSSAQFLCELDAIYEAGHRKKRPVFVASDNAMGNIPKAKEMLRETAAWQKARDYPFSITIEADVTIADDEELLDLLVQAGVKQTFLGLETPHEPTLIEWGKHQNVGRNLVADVKKLQRHGLIPFSGFMIGADNDPADIADIIIRFIRETGIFVAMVGMVQAIPGTALYDEMQKQGRLLNSPSGNNTDCPPNFVTRLSEETIVAAYHKIVSTSYSPEGFYETVRNFLKNYRSTGLRGRAGLAELEAFMRANILIGLSGGLQAKYYWKTLLLALSKHRQSFAEAVAAQVFGAHFRDRAERIQEI